MKSLLIEKEFCIERESFPDFFFFFFRGHQKKNMEFLFFLSWICYKKKIIRVERKIGSCTNSSGFFFFFVCERIVRKKEK